MNSRVAVPAVSCTANCQRPDTHILLGGRKRRLHFILACSGESSIYRESYRQPSGKLCDKNIGCETMRSNRHLRFLLVSFLSLNSLFVSFFFFAISLPNYSFNHVRFEVVSFVVLLSYCFSFLRLSFTLLTFNLIFFVSFTRPFLLSCPFLSFVLFDVTFASFSIFRSSLFVYPLIVLFFFPSPFSLPFLIFLNLLLPPLFPISELSFVRFFSAFISCIFSSPISFVIFSHLLFIFLLYFLCLLFSVFFSLLSYF